jgi:hypothetical protein
MAKAELVEEAGTAGAKTGPVDVLIGVAGTMDPGSAASSMDHAVAAFASTMPDARIAIAHVDMADATDRVEDGEVSTSARLLVYKPVNTGVASGAPWLTSVATYSSFFALARSTGARASVVISADLAALEHGAVADLAAPILAGECELVMPIYAQSRFDGLLNSSILSPLARALYGKRVRYPLAQDFAVSESLLPLFEQPAKRPQSAGETIFWPATQAAIHERKLCQVFVDVHHETVAEGIDLSTVLAQVVGPLFSDMETNAALWQRVRGSHAVPATGSPFVAISEKGDIDTRPMVDSFLLASRNLQDVWSLVLPPVTQLELKRLTRAAPEQFHLPDALWVRILYDFALAHRLRTLSRSHLMGALTPLYLAWVASYAGEVTALSDAEADARLEQLAAAYESGKPYLVSRWRWPDRFNP